MISRTEAAPHGAEAGFTLIEIMVVLAILGMMVGLIVARGPARSPTLDLQAAAANVARTLRTARVHAITFNRPVNVVFDARGNSISVDGMARPVPAGIAFHGAPGIRFSPDGSSSGGRIELAAGERRQLVGVDWLTGRVSIGSLP